MVGNLNAGHFGEPRGEAPADMLLAVFGGPPAIQLLTAEIQLPTAEN